MNIRRMNLLRQAVAEAPEERFDMQVWGCKHHPCGTSHCAAGWYATRFPAEGVPTSWNKDGYMELFPNDGFTQWQSLATHFGLLDGESSSIFLATECTRAEILRRIDAIIARHSEPSARYRPECGESAYAMAAVKVEQTVEV